MKHISVAVFIPVLLLSGTLFAQSRPSELQTVKDELKKAAAVTDDNARLKLYDALAKKCNPGLVQAKPVCKWSESVKINPLDDAKSIVLCNDADSESLMIRHSLGKTELYVCVREYLGSESAFVTYRVGKADAVSGEWGISSSSKSAFFNGDIDQLLKDMCEAEQFVVQITPYGEVPETAVFDIRGLKQLLIKYKDDFGCEFMSDNKQKPAELKPAEQSEKGPAAEKTE